MNSSSSNRTKFALVMFLFTLVLAAFSGIPVTAPTEQQQRAQGSEDPLPNNTTLAFQPRIPTSLYSDCDADRIADALGEEIAKRVLNDTSHDYANVVVALKSQPTAYDANTFAMLGGYITTRPWKNALYGFGGQIPYNRIADFALSDPNVLFIDKEHACQANLAYAARQIGARTYVWNNMSLQGDPQTSIAIVDTGIDDSHAAFSPGYGNQSFTHKIVGWNDQIDNSTTTPYDDNGHGSHVSGLATGQGFNNTDESGNAQTTFGIRFSSTDTGGRYYASAFMVNKTGTIKISVKWRGTGTSRISSWVLSYGDKTLTTGSWIQRNSTTTPAQNTWYNITYNVATTPAGGYDKYHVLLDFVGGSGETHATILMSWPYTPPNDGAQVWTGIAPQTRLVGVKVLDSTGSGTDTGLLDAIDWIIENRQTYHIVIVSMSLGFGVEVETVDIAIRSIVESGITTVLSAGNSGHGGNYVYTPASVDEAITVAASNQYDGITSYSSQGGTSRFTGQTIKPDITAPGGSFYAVPLFSADTNDNEAEDGFPEYQLDDPASMQGTSMSCPVVSGAASIVIQALGGYAGWQYTRSQALQPKMFLLMTATETYNNKRETTTASNSPTLGRGGKDVHEGYGRLNLDVAVDAILKTHQIGTTETATLGRPPIISDISRLGQKLAWARNVHLEAGGPYNFTLTVPDGADFDLYLYNSTGTCYGEPGIVQKSTTGATGGIEQILLNDAPYDGTYYLVVKRATTTTGAGTFTLESTGSSNRDIAVLSVESAPTVVYPIDPVNVTVTVKNKGSGAESFNVTAYYDASVIAKQTVLDLPPNNTTALNFTWNTLGVLPSHYAIIAQADLLPDELNTTDNMLQCPELVFIKPVGDANSDNLVNADDLVVFRLAFGSTLQSGAWNSECDFNRDDIVDAADLLALGKNYG